MNKCDNKGFTLIELSLSLAFISVLSLAVVFIINSTIASYRKGLTLNQINTVGMDLVDDMRTTIQGSSTKSVELAQKDCEGNRGKDDNDSNCENLISIRVVKENVPMFGAFCTGRYSYVWKSGEYFRDANGASGPSVVISGESNTNNLELSDFRFLKVRDDLREICMNYKSHDEVFNVSTSDEEPVDLLASSSGEAGLALYDLNVPNPAESNASNSLLYSVSFVLGTIQGGANVNAMQCDAPADSDANFDFCAINQFNFAALATGE